MTEKEKQKSNEDKDEIIKNAILNHLKIMWGNYQDDVCGVHVEDAIAWLEKQGKQKKQVHFPKFTFDDVLALQCCMETVKKVQEDKELYEKLNLIHSKIYDAYSSNTETINKKPTDKIEPKFKIGDWVVFVKSGSIYQVEKIENYEYTLRHVLGGSLCLPFSNENLIREWTIQDAKDGDVLVCNDEILLFKSYSEQGKISLYCWYNKYKNMFVDKEIIDISLTTKNKICPATKKQRDILFQKIKERKEKFDPKTLKPFDKVLTIMANEEWSTHLFSHIKKIQSSNPYVCNGIGYKCCIPYNDDTKHLVGTTEEAPEYYRYWEE